MNKMTKNSALKQVKFESKMEKSIDDGEVLTQEEEALQPSEILQDGIVEDMVEGLLPAEKLEEKMLYAKQKKAKKPAKAKKEKKVKDKREKKKKEIKANKSKNSKKDKKKKS
jgi:hypothetical protein